MSKERGKQVQLRDNDLSWNTSIKNDQLKGVDTSKMIAVHLKDGHNTVIFCKDESEVAATRKIYEDRFNNFNTVSVINRAKENAKAKKKKEEENPIEEIPAMPDTEDPDSE